MSAAEQDVIARLTQAFDFHDPEYTPARAQEISSAVRENAAVTYSPAHGGLWILSRYQDVRAALRDHQTFSSAAGVHFPRAAGMPKFAPIDFDPPEQTVLRDLMAPPLQKEALEGIRPALEELARQLIEPLAERGHADLGAELALPFAIGALGLMVGLSEDAQRAIRELTSKLWARLATDADSSGFWPEYRDLLDRELNRARNGPGDNYLSWLTAQRIDGEPVPDETLYSIIVSFTVAGHDNTMNGISRILWYLAGHPELQRRLAGQPDLALVVIEETLRRWCPTDRMTRTTTRAVTIDGVTIPAGARVVLLFDGANRDPRQFPEPDEFRPERGNSYTHLSLGSGLHHCLGAQAARLEFATILRELARHPVYRLDREPEQHFENGRHIMFDAVPVHFGRPGRSEP